MIEACNIETAQYIARENRDCRTRPAIAAILWAYRQLGYNNPTLHHASHLMQFAANCQK